MKNKNTKRSLINSFHKNNRFAFFAAIIFSFLNTACLIVVSWLLGAVVDAVTASDWERLKTTGIIMIVSVVTMFAMQSAMTACKSRYIHRGIQRYKERAFDALSRKSVSAFSTESTSAYLSALTNDVASIETNYLNNNVMLVYYSLMFVMTVGVMLFYSPLLTLFVIILSVIPIIISVVMGNGLSARELTVSNENEAFTARLKDLLNGFAVIKSFKAEQRTADLFRSENSRLEKNKEARRRFEGILGAASGSSGAAVQFAIIFIGCILVLRGEITVGTVMVFVNLCNYVNWPIVSIPEALAGRKAAKGLIDKLSALLDENPGEEGEAAPAALREGIVLSNVSFGYEDGKPVLSGISCEFEAGKSYAIVGASGSGKTTLLQLLLGAQRGYEGSLTVDGAEMRGLSSDSVCDLMSLIGQNVFLFDDTIRSNITMFAPFPDDKVSEAIRLAGLSEVTAQRGEDYRCGENGRNLSGGERQRISIARSLLRGSSVLLVDEATSALDNSTAAQVSNAILGLDGLTRIVVTHRLDAGQLERYDGIIMLKNGAICESGSFDRLMEKKGQFYSLYTVSNG